MTIFIVSIFALIFGSFVSLLTYRLSSNEKIVFTRSKCVNCGCVLDAQNLVPLFSWLFQRGKCSKCKCKISIRYPLIELTFLITFLIIYFSLHQQINPKMVLSWAIASTLIAMCITDLEHYFIPNLLQYIFAILAAIFVIQINGSAAVLPAIKSAFAYTGFGIALLAFFYFTVRLEALGIDDIKFFFIAGFLLGLNNFLLFMMLSGIFGCVFGSLWQKIKKDETFPFAPAICLSCFLCMVLDHKINPVNLLGSLLFF